MASKTSGSMVKPRREAKRIARRARTGSSRMRISGSPMVEMRWASRSARPPDVVDHLALGRVVEEAVHREVAAARVLLGGAEDVVAGDEQVGVAGDVVAHVHRVLPEGRDLDDLAVAEEDVGQPEAPPDEPAVAEDGAHLAGVGVGGQVEVLGRAPEQRVAHAAAHEVGLVPHRSGAAR